MHRLKEFLHLAAFSLDVRFGPDNQRWIGTFGARITAEEGFGTNRWCVWVLSFQFLLVNNSYLVIDWSTEFCVWTPSMSWAPLSPSFDVQREYIGPTSRFKSVFDFLLYIVYRIPIVLYGTYFGGPRNEIMWLKYSRARFDEQYNAQQK